MTIKPTEGWYQHCVEKEPPTNVNLQEKEADGTFDDGDPNEWQQQRKKSTRYHHQHC